MPIEENGIAVGTQMPLFSKHMDSKVEPFRSYFKKMLGKIASVEEKTGEGRRVIQTAVHTRANIRECVEVSMMMPAHVSARRFF